MTKLVIFSEEDIYLPCVFFRPKGAETLPVIVIADSEGKTSSNVSLALTLAKAGYALLMVDLRGYGETMITERSSRDEAGGFEAQTLGIEAGVAYDGLKLGRSIFAMRVFDLLQALKYLATRDDIDADKIGLIGRSSCGPLALYAALLEERVEAVLTDSSLATFSRLVTSRLYTYHFMDFLPEALRYHDLPQVAGTLAPRVLWMLNLRDAQKNRLELATAKADYAWTEKCYDNLGQMQNLRIGSYDSQANQNQLYLTWAKSALSGP